MGTACFAYSLVQRPGDHVRGASKAELLSSIFAPDVPYPSAEEVFNALTAPPGEGGLGALERTKSKAKAGDRYYLSIKQTLTMYHSNATGMISAEQALDTVWTRAKHLAAKGVFGRLVTLDQPANPGTPSIKAFDGVDAQENRLVILDPRRWTLMNGKDTATRADLDTAFGITPGLVSNNAASMVVAIVTTQRRERAKAMARDYLAWQQVTQQINPDDEEYPTAVERMEDASKKLDEAVRWAYQYYAYLLGGTHQVVIQYRDVPDTHTSLSGDNVWTALTHDQRATRQGSLSGDYVAQLIDAGLFGRDLTLKEIFAMPYTNANWPLITSTDDLRQALFALVHEGGWMIVNSDSTEARPDTPAQIQTSTINQTLTKRPEPEPEPVDQPGESAEDKSKPTGGATTTPEAQSADAETVYDRTSFTLSNTSITDLSKREQIWQMIAQLASFLDPAKAAGTDLQMVNFYVTITAREGDTQALVDKANETPNMRTRVEEDELMTRA